MKDQPAGGWRATLEAIPQLVWTADLAGRPDWFNTRWYAYTGASAADLLAGGYLDAIHRDDLAAARAAYADAIARGEAGRPSTGCAAPTAPTAGTWAR